ncbi:MAG TPA: hypothetical protein VIK35_11045 [Verrucomicrobiae bacterium]
MKFAHLAGLHFTKTQQKPLGRYDKDTLRSFRGFHHNLYAQVLLAGALAQNRAQTNRFPARGNGRLNDYLDLLEAVPASVLHEKARKQFSLAAYCRLD